MMKLFAGIKNIGVLTFVGLTQFFKFLMTSSMLLYTKPTSVVYDSTLFFLKSKYNASNTSFSYLSMVLLSLLNALILNSTFLVACV